MKAYYISPDSRYIAFQFYAEKNCKLFDLSPVIFICSVISGITFAFTDHGLSKPHAFVKAMVCITCLFSFSVAFQIDSDHFYFYNRSKKERLNSYGK